MAGQGESADQTRELAAALTVAGVADVDASTLTRGMYSSDASLYRVVPLLVVRPRHVEEVLATVATCAALKVPLTSRGAGTSIAGNAVGPGVVLDFARHLNTVINLDPEAGSATVEPGRGARDAAARAPHRHGLRFGPDPSTQTRCTVGGMIGNNACGSRALGYGRTADNVLGWTWSPSAASRLSLARAADAPASESLGRLRDVVDRWPRHHPHGIRPVRPAGVRLQPGAPVAGDAGSTSAPSWPAARAPWRSRSGRRCGWCGTRRIVSCWSSRATPSMAVAADNVPAILAFRPDRRARAWIPGIVDVVRGRAGAGCPSCRPARVGCSSNLVGEHPAGRSLPWPAELAAASGTAASRLVADAGEQTALWRIREEGAGLAARTLDRPALSGWEDAAVPPERLGGVPAGVRGAAGRAPAAGACRTGISVTAACTSGSTSRWTSRAVGDGSATSSPRPPFSSRPTADRCPANTATAGPARELLPAMYSADAIGPVPAGEGGLRPRKPAQPRCAGRAGGRRRRPARLRARRGARATAGCRLLHDGGDFGAAVHRCTGVGKCIADNSRRRRRDVPVVPGHPGGEGLHPRSGPDPAGNDRRPARRRRLAVAGGAPGAGFVPVLQGLSE